MNSGIVLRTGIALTLASISLLSACGDDDSSTTTENDAGDASANATDSSSTGEVSTPTETRDTSETSATSVSDADANTATSAGGDAGTSADASDDSSSAAGTDIDGSSSSDSGVDSNEDDSGLSPADAGNTSADAEVGPPVGWVGLEVGEAVIHSVDVAADGDDGYYGITFDTAGNFYTIGTATDTSGETPDVYLAVTKFLANGEIDETFGTDGDGVARINVAPGGTEVARGIVIQNVESSADAGASSSYLVVAGTAQFNPDVDGLAANEQDAVIVRFGMDGRIDEDFGTLGVVTIDFNSGNEGLNNQAAPAWINNDTVWSISTTMGDRLVIHGSQRGEGDDALADGGTTPRVDSDWVLLRLLADGTLDDSFGDQGKVLLDIGRAGASARSATVLPDGSIVGVGYLSSDVLGVETQQPVLYKVDSDGNFDPTFATSDAWAADGVFHDTVVAPPLRAEAYGAAPQGDKFVTMGYGPSNVGGGLTSDIIALRFTADGQFDTTFGNAGATYLDYAGQGDNGRSVLILPDNTILAIGGGRTLGEDLVSTQSDGVLALLTPDGEPIDAFGTDGIRGYDFDGGLTDFFWAGAVSPSQNSAVIVGIKGGVETDAGVTDSSSVVLILPLTELSN